MGKQRGAVGVAWTTAVLLLLGTAVAVDHATGEKHPTPGLAAAAEQIVPVLTPAPVVTSSAPRVTAPPRTAPSPTSRPTVGADRAATPTAKRRSTPRTAAPEPAVTTQKPRRTAPAPVVDVAPARFAAPRDRFAFLVGVQRYPAPTHDTVASVGDVVLIRQVLLNAGWLPQNIRVVLDGKATGAAIRNGVAWLATKSVPGKTFSFFHYSGHVKQFGGQHEALWPVDRDWVHDSELASRLSRVRGRMWVDIAGCEAASFMPGVASSRVLFSGSSKATEKSYENAKQNASVWTGLLFRTAPFRGDANRDGQVTIGEALRYSQHFARIVTSRQRPHGPQTPQVGGDRVRGWTLSAPPA